MITTKSLPWGEITGKLSLTPEQAKKMLGFNMRPDAKGIFFRKRNGKIEVCNLIPAKFTVITKAMQQGRDKMRVITNIVKTHFKDLICPIWNKEAKNTNHIAGTQFFISTNMLNVGKPAKWENLIISLGKLPKPEFTAEYCPTTKNIKITPAGNTTARMINEKLQPNFAAFDTVENKLYHPLPHSLSITRYQTSTILINLPFKLPRHWDRQKTILFMYLTQDNEYSPSTANILKRCSNFTHICTIKTEAKRKCPLMANLNN